MRRLALLTVLTLTVATLGSTSLSAREPAATYDWFAGAGPVCGLGRDACPAIARDTQTGDTIEIRATGTLTNHPASVDGGGTFVHRKASGGIVAKGTFTALELLSFEDWGASPDPSFPPEFRAGRARILTHGVVTHGPARGFEADAILEVTCVLPDAPGVPAGAHEGVTVDIIGVISFEQEVSGLTLFIVQ
jgi:hypothetical protein